MHLPLHACAQLTAVVELQMHALGSSRAAAQAYWKLYLEKVSFEMAKSHEYYFLLRYSCQYEDVHDCDWNVSPQLQLQPVPLNLVPRPRSSAKHDQS